MKKNKARHKDISLVVGLVIAVTASSHFVITNPLGPSRVIYHVEAAVIQWQTRCSKGAPEWMSKAQRYATRNMGALASQLAFITPDRELHHCETGWKDGAFGDVKLLENTRFRFASATKTVTAIAVLKLVNQQRLALDDKIVDVLNLEGGFKDPRVRSITIEQLLMHKGGWDRERGQDAMFMRNKKPWCPYKPGKLTQTTLMFDPGEAVTYSNLGYCLLGLAVENITGMSFRDYIEKNFNFNDSTLAFINGPFLADEVEYDFRHENFFMDDYYSAFDFFALSSAVGLSGNASDLGMLVKSSFNEGPTTILDGGPTNSCDLAQIQSCYGYGMFRYQPVPESIPLYIHDGKLPGATSAILVTPDEAVLVWLGAGTPPSQSNARQEFYDYLRKSITNESN